MEIKKLIETPIENKDEISKLKTSVSEIKEEIGESVSELDNSIISIREVL